MIPGKTWRFGRGVKKIPALSAPTLYNTVGYRPWSWEQMEGESVKTNYSLWTQNVSSRLGIFVTKTSELLKCQKNNSKSNVTSIES